MLLLWDHKVQQCDWGNESQFLLKSQSFFFCHPLSAFIETFYLVMNISCYEIASPPEWSHYVHLWKHFNHSHHTALCLPAVTAPAIIGTMAPLGHKMCKKVWSCWFFWFLIIFTLQAFQIWKECYLLLTVTHCVCDSAAYTWKSFSKLVAYAFDKDVSSYSFMTGDTSQKLLCTVQFSALTIPAYILTSLTSVWICGCAL